ncbi:class II aldolase/adducin family protein [Aquihabitans sp. G128]|uniref:class II aldolase/adducin family protein n=1 Tax=Aquihabitans sp. G128 TaxID=2849779 RepID=UPI001C218B4D|nr:class II aldolase/adducin family protein [Aquihabitans sp. G128]QXC61979.1 class II aldolase/adducin family protein [Aquihabitans sp. G128]
MPSKRTPHPMFVERSTPDERLWRKQRLALAFRIFGRLGFDEGVAGHITARDPEHDDHFWVNPFGMSFKQITADDLILVNHAGEVVEGSWPVNQAAFAIHSGIHAARPDVVAAAHSHSKFGRAWSTLGETLSPITQDSCIFYDDHVLFDDYTGVVNDPEEGKRIAHALGEKKAAILRNHGILTVGQSIEETVFWYVTMERTCEVELLARAAGTPQPIGDEVARQTYDNVGGHLAGWFSGQPLFDWIAEQEPDAYGDAAPVS